MNLDPATPKHYLFPGALFAVSERHHVTTVLGSCISVCLWDPVRRIGGINHYLLPFWNGEGLATPRYGNVAIPKLIERLIRLGANQTHLKAKIFGGSAMWDRAQGLMSIGERNIELAQTMLDEAKIPLVTSDVGGNRGRKIIFDTGEGAVLLRRHPLREGIESNPAQKRREPSP